LKICCTSDLHGSLPDIPDCDLLLIGGDLCYSSNFAHQLIWLEDDFKNWVNKIVCRGIDIVCIAGNHDFLMESHPELWKEIWHNYPTALDGRFHYLENNGKTINRLKIWGTPGSLPFGNWAFNYPEEKLEHIFSSIDVADIIISHGPPLGYGDWALTSYGGEHVGSRAALNLIDRIQPKLFVTAHLHESYGEYQRGTTKIVNASLMTRDYRPNNKPILLEL
jgi:Icc-related predicted phosphoesterase